MEIVRTDKISPEELIKFLIHGDGLKKLIGTDACACFIACREITSPKFFDSLIKNINAIDSTTRNNIAFIVFYGETNFFAKATSYCRSHQYIQAKIDNFSVSHSFNTKFDDEYGHIFRELPEKVNTNRLSSIMNTATDCLMDHFKFKESDIPCVIFCDPKNTYNSVAINLTGSDLIDSLYRQVLSPLSDAFRDLERWIKLNNECKNSADQCDRRSRAVSYFESYIDIEPELSAEYETLNNLLRKCKSAGNTLIPHPKILSAHAQLNDINNQLDALYGVIKSGNNSKLKSFQLNWLLKRKTRIEHRLKSWTLGWCIDNLESRKKTISNKISSIQHKARSFRCALEDIPENIKSIHLEKLEQLKKETSDWSGVLENWKRDKQPYQPPSIGPRAFGVVMHVLGQPKK